MSYSYFNDYNNVISYHLYIQIFARNIDIRICKDLYVYAKDDYLMLRIYWIVLWLTKIIAQS